MATSTEKGSILFETVVFFYLVATMLFFLSKNIKDPKSQKFSTSKFIYNEKLKELQDTQIKSLKEYEVK